MTPVPDFHHLPDERISELLDVALNCELMGADIQAGLLVGIDRKCVASMPRISLPVDSLLVTLNYFNGIERLEDGSVPLLQWLRRAYQLRRDLPAADLFERCIQEIASRPVRAAPGNGSAGPLRTDARLSDELRLLHEQRASALSRGEDAGPVIKAIRDLKRLARNGVPLQPGELLGDGRYQLLGTLGAGGYGTVWEAWDYGRQCYVAIKVLHGHLLQDGARVERFFRGAEKMSQLDHPNIVKVLLKRGEEQRAEGARYFFYVMELLKGGDFKRRVQASPPGEQEVLRIALAVCDALVHAHQQGLLHRDVSPDNILLDEAGVAHLSDFDLVRAEDTTAATLGGHALGKYGFAAPEVLEGRVEPDARADVYSLGMTLLFALNRGGVPTAEVAREPVIHGLKCSALTREALLGATREAAEKRYPDMEAFRTALWNARDASGTASFAGWLRLGGLRYGRSLGRDFLLVTATSAIFVLLFLATPMRDVLLTLATGYNMWGPFDPVKLLANEVTEGASPSPDASGARAGLGVLPERRPEPFTGDFKVGDSVLVDVLSDGRDAYAAAFFVTADGDLVTASEVVLLGRKAIRIRLRDGRQFDARVLDVERDVGLALLKVAIRPGHFARWGIAREGQGIAVHGLWVHPETGEVEPEGLRWATGHVVDGHTSNTEGMLMISTDVVLQGFSGGPVLNERGEVVGVLSSGDSPGTRHRCIPSWVIENYVRRVLARGSSPDAGP